MKKKKTALAKQFIALDSDSDVLIGIGSLGDLKKMIECYADEQGYDADAVNDLLIVYELGPVRAINAVQKNLEVFIKD